MEYLHHKSFPAENRTYK